MKPLEVEKTVYHHKGEQESEWAVWENYRSTEKKGQGGQSFSQGANFSENLDQIATFENLKEFGLFWHNSFYDDSSNQIYNSQDETEKRVMRNDKTYVIDCINVFRKGIRPEWEDPVNGGGYDLRVELDVNPDKNSRESISDTYKQLWQDFVFGVIGEECVFAEEIVGIRYKYQANKNAVRVEVWIKAKKPSMCPKETDKQLGGNLESINDNNQKTYWGIRIWLEDTIKNVRKNLGALMVQTTDHNK